MTKRPSDQVSTVHDTRDQVSTARAAQSQSVLPFLDHDASIGIDNGSSGSIAIVTPDSAQLFPTPVKRTLNYQKDASYITRIDHDKLYDLVDSLVGGYDHPLITLERPLVNPGRFAATASALRAFESTILVVERLGFTYRTVDSRSWQRRYLPPGTKGPALKPASAAAGIRRWPHLAAAIDLQGDADALFIAQLALETAGVV